jgi:hypothetical protein
VPKLRRCRKKPASPEQTADRLAEELGREIELENSQGPQEPPETPGGRIPSLGAPQPHLEPLHASAGGFNEDDSDLLLPEEDDEEPTPADSPIAARGTRKKERVKLPPAEFWALLKRGTQKDWARWVLYAYRRFPVIDKKKLDPKAATNIDKVTHAIDDRYLLRTHGSGEYALMLTDADRPKGSRCIAKTDVSLNDPDWPPVIDVAELVIGHPQNRSYEARLKAEHKHPEQQMEQATNQKDPMLAMVNTLMNRVLAEPPGQNHALNLVTAAYTTAMQNAIGQNDPTKIISVLKELQTAMGPRGGGELATILPVIVSIIQSSNQQTEAVRNQQLQLMQQVITSFASKPPAAAPNPATGSVLNQITELATTVQTLQGMGLFGGGAAAPAAETGSSWVGPLIQSFAPIVGQLLQMGMAALARRGQPEAAAAAPGAPPPPGVTSSQLHNTYYPPQAAAPPPGTSVPPPVYTPPPPQPAAAEPAAPGMSQQELAMVFEFGDRLASALHREQGGADFAEGMASWYGIGAYEQVQSLGLEGILTKLQSVPQVWGKLAAGEKRLRLFLQDFLTAFVEEGPGGVPPGMMPTSPPV